MTTFKTFLYITTMAFVLGNVQANETLSIERIFESPSLSGPTPRNLKVSPDGTRVTFLQGKEDDYERLDLWEYHIESGKTQLLVNSDDLVSGDENLSDEEKARRERMRLSGTGIVAYSWSADSESVLFPLAGDAYLYRLATADTPAKVIKLLDTEAFETDVTLSPLGNYIGYIREQNLYVKHIATDTETAITTEGGGQIKFGMAEFVAQEEMGRLTGFWFSPDEKHVAFTRVDETHIEVINRSEIYADEIKMIEQKYPLAGTDNALVEGFVQSLSTGARMPLDLNHGLNSKNPLDIYFTRGAWADKNTFTFQIQNRTQQHLVLNSFDLSNQKTKTLLTENSATWVNLHDDLHFLDDQQHFIWASERNGYKHLYLYHKEKGLINAITQGEWVVTKLNAIDSNAEKIYFSGRKDTPLENHLYQVSFDGSDLKKVSTRKGFHDITFSKNGTIYVDRFSTINSPSQVSLHSASGDQLTWLEENAVDKNHPLYPYQKQWVKPEFGKIQTQDGVDLHYRLFKPKSIKGKHPVIVFVYGGPGAQVVTNRWAGRRGLLMQHWVDKGYIVFSIDNRGSNYRGKAFEDPIYQKMGDIEVKDQIEGVRFLRSLDYVDGDRIGIHGHSYGGYMTIMSMFKGADYFAAGVSGAPVTDWRLYDTHYTERYMGNPKQTEDAYIKSSVFPYAENLKGELLIYHGMADDNVLFTHSTKLYKQLQDLAKPFEVMDYPGKKHSIRGKATGTHLYHTITRFFDRTIGK